MGKRVTHFSHENFVSFALRHTYAGAILAERDIMRSGPRQGEEHSLHADNGLFLEGGALEAYLSLKRKARRKERHEAKRVRREAAGLPYGQGAKSPAAVVVAEAEPVDRAPKYVTVGRPKAHAPAKHVKRWTDGKAR